jgi:major membrane immunogen (membrane-anchored lipoprotein)
MIKQVTGAVIAACLLVACSKGSDGKAVSASETPRNPAVSTETHPTDVAQTAGANSFTADQAKGHIEKAGYAQVSELAQTPDGLWQGKAMKDGKPVSVSVDYKGAVLAQ